MTYGIAEVVPYSVSDIRHITARDSGYNPAQGTGRMPDQKFIKSRGEEARLRSARGQGRIEAEDDV